MPAPALCDHRRLLEGTKKLMLLVARLTAGRPTGRLACQARARWATLLLLRRLRRLHAARCALRHSLSAAWRPHVQGVLGV